MTRILASIFYISSMRKASEELNKAEVIANVGVYMRKRVEGTAVLGKDQSVSGEGAGQRFARDHL